MTEISGGSADPVEREIETATHPSGFIGYARACPS
jgi:hypothetical protein